MGLGEPWGAVARLREGVLGTFRLAAAEETRNFRVTGLSFEEFWGALRSLGKLWEALGSFGSLQEDGENSTTICFWRLIGEPWGGLGEASRGSLTHFSTGGSGGNP